MKIIKIYVLKIFYFLFLITNNRKQFDDHQMCFLIFLFFKIKNYFRKQQPY